MVRRLGQHPHLPEFEMAYVYRFQSSLQTGFYLPELRFPFSPQAVRKLRQLSKTYDFFHSELGQGVTCYRARVPYGLHILGVGELSALFGGNVREFPFLPIYRKVIDQARYVVVATENLLQPIRRIRNDVTLLPDPVEIREMRHHKHEPGEKLLFFSPSRMDQ